MHTVEFYHLVDKTIHQTERGIGSSGVNIQTGLVGNVMTLKFEDASQITIRRNFPLYELWMSSKSGRYYFANKGAQWRCTRSGQELSAVLKRECSLHAGERVDW